MQPVRAANSAASSSLPGLPAGRRDHARRGCRRRRPGERSAARELDVGVAPLAQRVGEPLHIAQHALNRRGSRGRRSRAPRAGAAWRPACRARARCRRCRGRPPPGRTAPPRARGRRAAALRHRALGAAADVLGPWPVPGRRPRTARGGRPRAGRRSRSAAAPRRWRRVEEKYARGSRRARSGCSCNGGRPRRGRGRHTTEAAGQGVVEHRSHQAAQRGRAAAHATRRGRGSSTGASASAAARTSRSAGAGGSCAGSTASSRSRRRTTRPGDPSRPVPATISVELPPTSTTRRAERQLASVRSRRGTRAAPRPRRSGPRPEPMPARRALDETRRGWRAPGSPRWPRRGCSAPPGRAAATSGHRLGADLDDRGRE